MCINQSIGNVEDSLWTDVPLLEMTFHIYLRFYIHKHDKGVFLINYLMKKNCLWLSDKISRWPIETCLPECTADRCLFVLELIKPRPRTKLLQINWAPRFNQHCWSTISRPNEPLAPGLPLLTLLYSTCIYKTWRLHYFNPQHVYWWSEFAFIASPAIDCTTVGGSDKMKVHISSDHMWHIETKWIYW